MFGFFRPVQAAEEQPAAAEGRPAEEQPAAAAAEGRPAPRPLLGIRLLSGSIGHILAWHSRISVGRPGSARGPGEAFFFVSKKETTVGLATATRTRFLNNPSIGLQWHSNETL